jgi:hypothetical protein
MCVSAWLSAGVPAITGCGEGSCHVRLCGRSRSHGRAPRSSPADRRRRPQASVVGPSACCARLTSMDRTTKFYASPPEIPGWNTCATSSTCLSLNDWKSNTSSPSTRTGTGQVRRGHHLLGGTRSCRRRDRTGARPRHHNARPALLGQGVVGDDDQLVSRGRLVTWCTQSGR